MSAWLIFACAYGIVCSLYVAYVLRTLGLPWRFPR